MQPITPAPEVPLTSTDPHLLEKRGDGLREQKDYLQAIDYYNAALKLKPRRSFKTKSECRTSACCDLTAQRTR